MSSSVHREQRARHPDRGIARYDEERIIRRLFRSIELHPDSSVLDVACGYGRKMDWLRQEGLNVEGVDINATLVASVRDRGLRACTTEEFESSTQMYDAMLMAHIVEHFAPRDLLVFMDHYLDRLKIGGHLIISTPLMWSQFYNDFDHTKPFDPTAFLAVFCQADGQVQYQSRNRLKLTDLGLRRVARTQPTVEKLYTKFWRPDPLWRLSHGGVDKVRALLFHLSGGACWGVSNGWVGLFKKVS